MHQIIVEKILQKSPDIVWGQLADIQGLYKFYPLLKASPLQKGSSPSGEDAKRTCHFHDGNWAHERVIKAVQEKKLGVDIYESSLPLKSCEVNFILEEAGAEKTRLKITADYVLKFGLLGKFLNFLMLKRQFTRNLSLMIEGFNEYLLTGKNIPKGWTPNTLSF